MLRSLLVPAGALVLLAGCAHKQKPAEAPAAAPTPVAVRPAPSPAAPPTVKSCATDLQCGPKQLCIESRCVAVHPDLAQCRAGHVSFDFNSAQLRPEDRGELDRVARCLRADHGMRVQIEGNADERGTEEYNLHLGSRRAAAVQSYLSSLGVSPGQLKTISFGEIRPVCSEQNEGCWAKNRRAALVTDGT